MTNETREAVAEILKKDKTISDCAKGAVLVLMDEGLKTQAEQKPAVKIWTRAEVARALKKSVKSVDIYARRGLLTRINPKGLKRSIGYTDESVRRLCDGVGNGEGGGK